MADETSVQRRKNLSLFLADKPPMTLAAIARELNRDQTSVWVDLDHLRMIGVATVVRGDDKHVRNGMPVMRWKLKPFPAETPIDG
jgi:predicted ArsR family transcriptional regulator